MGALEQITLYVGEDTEKVWLVNENFYDLKYGLNFNREEENNDDFE
jgi:hypothetical protein